MSRDGLIDARSPAGVERTRQLLRSRYAEQAQGSRQHSVRDPAPCASARVPGSHSAVFGDDILSKQPAGNRVVNGSRARVASDHIARGFELDRIHPRPRPPIVLGCCGVATIASSS
jgi:hypothetical protein